MELIEIGKTGKPFGTEGLLRCFIEARYLPDFLASDVLFVRLHGQAVPFFIVEATGNEESVQVRIEEIDDREAAQILTGKEIFLRPADILLEQGAGLETPKQEYEGWIGFRLKDLTEGDIGTIKSFMELPQQLFALVDYQEKEIMIPFQEQLILDLDLSTKTVLMDLPEGLLSL